MRLSLLLPALAAPAAHALHTCRAGRVLTVATVPLDRGQLTVTETECPGFAPVSTPQLGKRTVTQCTNGGCTVVCESTGAQPTISDCESLTQAVQKNYPNMFSVNAGTMTTFSYHTCAFGFANLDTVPYDVCYLGFGYNGAITADQCFADYPAPKATSGGYCLSPGTASDKWGIEVFNPEGKVE